MENSTLPATFFSSGDSNTGSATYVVIVPVLTLAIYAMVGGLLHAVSVALGANPDLIGKLSAMSLLPLTFVLVTAFAVKDFRRRAGGRIDVLDEGIIMSSQYYAFDVGKEEIADVRIVSERLNESCRLELASGRRLLILNEVASYQELRDSFEASLIPVLACRKETELKTGDMVRVTENRLRAVLRIAIGCLTAAIGLFLFFLIPIVPWIPGVRQSWRRIRQGWRGWNGGFSLTIDALSKIGFVEGFPIDLGQLVDVAEDDIGVTLHFDDGSKMCASLFAKNYWTISYLLRSIDGSVNRTQA